jgi:hypothetical protein
MIALADIKVTAADHTKSLAIILAEILCRQLEQQICQCDFIQFNALAFSNDIIIIIAADGRNNNMVEVEVIISVEFLQTSVTDDTENKINRILQVNDTSSVIDAAVHLNRRRKAAASDVRELVRSDLTVDIL